MTKHQDGILDAFLELFDDGPQRVSRAKPKKPKRSTSWLDFFAGRHTFIIEMTDHGWSGYQCECLLRKYGIPVKNRFVWVGKEGDMMPPSSLCLWQESKLPGLNTFYSAPACLSFHQPLTSATNSTEPRHYATTAAYLLVAGVAPSEISQPG